MKRTLMSVVVLAGALTLAGCSGSEEPAEQAPSAAGAESGTDSAHNDADVMFAQMMIPHHEQAITMADMVLAKDGTSPEVAELATEVKAAQAPEIEQLGEWLDAWGADRAAEHAGHAGMSGMMSEDDLRLLEEAGAPESDRLFLEQMIAHHRGAVEMAQTEVESGAAPDAVELAQTVVETQTTEIEAMEDLLTSM